MWIETWVGNAKEDDKVGPAQARANAGKGKERPENRRQAAGVFFGDKVRLGRRAIHRVNWMLA
ncbi:MAG: hypothetical protein ACYDC6_07790 [Acidobacteriaceae bacterium]